MIWETEHDLIGRTVTVTEPLGVASASTFDPIGRLSATWVDGVTLVDITHADRAGATPASTTTQDETNAEVTVTRDGLSHGSLPLEVVTESGEVITEIVVEGVRLGQQRSGEAKPTPIVTDPRGAVLQLGGKTLPAFGAFGENTQGPSVFDERHLFAGLESIPEAPGVMLAQHRAYHPRTGRFLSPDPLGLAGGSDSEDSGDRRAETIDDLADEWFNAAVELAETAQRKVQDAKDFLNDVKDATERLGLPEAFKMLASAGLDGVQATLGVLGLFPGLGEIADGIDLLISLARGDRVGVALGIAALNPVGGQVAGLAKIARNAERAASGARSLSQLADASSSINTATKLRGKAVTPSTQGGFVVHPNGTAVHRSQAEMVESITGAGATRVGHATQTTEGGVIYSMTTPNGLMDVRVMNGRTGGDLNQGPRTVTTRAGTNDGVQANGERVKVHGSPGGPTKAQIQEAMHTHGQVHDR